MSRRRWVYTEGGVRLPEPIEVTQEWRNTAVGAPRRSEAEVYGNLTATDGTPIDSRRKHREYMASHGLAMAEDFKGTWEKAAKERQEMRSGGTQAVRRERREDIGRALYQLEHQPRRR